LDISVFAGPPVQQRAKKTGPRAFAGQQIILLVQQIILYVVGTEAVRNTPARA
jgi:hypothetical protein